jgi:hypothetical protein
MQIQGMSRGLNNFVISRIGLKAPSITRFRRAERRRSRPFAPNPTSYGPDTQSETGFRKAPRPLADKTALICGNYKGDSRGVTNWSLLAGMEWWRTCA